jgi:hypothetical protein
MMVGFGVATGLSQQRVLRRALGEARCWPQATGVGLGVGVALAAAAGLGDTPGLVAQIAQGAVAGAAGGAVIGTLQWVVLTAQVCEARWWVVASVAGWATGTAVGGGVAYYAAGFDRVISPVVAASVTGIAVAALLRSQTRDASAPRTGGCRQSASSRPTSSPAPYSGQAPNAIAGAAVICPALGAHSPPDRRNPMNQDMIQMARWWGGDPTAGEDIFLNTGWPTQTDKNEEEQ